MFFNAHRTLICNSAVLFALHEQLSCPRVAAAVIHGADVTLPLSSVHLKPLLTLLELCTPQLLKLLVFTSACLKWLPRATQADFQRNLTTRQGPLYTDIYPCVFFASRYHGRQIMSFTWARIPTKDQNIQVSFSELVSLLELFTGAHTSTQDCIQHPWGFQVSLEQLY